MNTADKNQLLHEVLCGDEFNAWRDATLARGLEALRRRQRRRRQFQAAALLAPLLVLWWHWQARPALPTVSASAPVPARPAEVETARVKYITKQELFALFPNRPIALIGQPGHQQFLLLDELPPVQQP
jgi:hypothetical protein